MDRLRGVSVVAGAPLAPLLNTGTRVTDTDGLIWIGSSFLAAAVVVVKMAGTTLAAVLAGAGRAACFLAVALAAGVAGNKVTAPSGSGLLLEYLKNL